MALEHLWAGRAYGTNTGNLFVKLSGGDDALSGSLHLNDPSFGLTVYRVSGKFDGSNLELFGEPETVAEDVILGKLSAKAKLNTKGELIGEWETDIGSSGTFVLFPHDTREEKVPGDPKEPEQLHTARYNFGAIAIGREQISALADEIQADFNRSEVVVTVVAGTEQTRLLSNFKKKRFDAERATVIKLYVQQPEAEGLNRVAVVEFGPQYNMVMVQGADEAWALGMLEKLKRHIQPFERTYATNFKKFGFGINQFLLVGAIVFLPSLATVRDRAVLVVGVLAIILGMNWLHGRFLPNAAIFLIPKPKGAIAANLVSWLIAVTSAVVAALLAAYLEGQIPFVMP